MLSNFLTCLNAVIPLIIYLAIGAVVRRTKLLDDREVTRMNHMLFNVFFPVLMFDNLYSSDVDVLIDVKLLIYAVVFVFCVYFISIPIVCRIEKNQKSRGAMIQAIYRSNFILMGLPVTLNIFGPGKVSDTAMLIAVIVPIYNILAVITLEYFRGGHVSGRQIILKIITNPLILGAVAAGICLGLNVVLPDPVQSVVSGMSAATTPVALVLLGASFDYRTIAGNARDLAVCVTSRLLIVPAAGLGIAAALGFRGPQLVALIAMMATPMAVSSYTMASSMDSDADLAGNCVVLSTPLSCVTIFLWLFLFKSLGMF